MAGSIRRARAEVHDIDLVVWARYHDTVMVDLFGGSQEVMTPPVSLIEVIRQVDVGFEAPPVVDPKVFNLKYDGLPVEIYLCERDGGNFGALLQMRTGSEDFNRYLAGSARHRGMYYRAGYGIYEHDDRGCKGDFGQRLDDGSEEGIFSILGIPYRKPEERF